MGRLIDVLLSQCGVRPDRATGIWLLAVALSIWLSVFIHELGDPRLSIGFASATMAAYYLGNSVYLTRWSAAARGLEGAHAERAWTTYQVVLGLMFLNQGLGFSAVCHLQLPGTRLPIDETAATVAGVSISALGIATKTWATMIVGVDCYYYRDLFFRRRVWCFSRRGPYAVLANPMYGVGNLQAYGLAIFSRSSAGLVAAVLCHAAIYAFYCAVERPFVRRTLAEPAQTV
jgi:protein-S-isoprenylcysteine O-methyltransferase Ste14